MPVIGLTLADPEIAAVTFKTHLDQLWGMDWMKRRQWQRKDLDSMHVLVTLPGTRLTGEVDPYYVRLGAEYYDAGPPSVAFVNPEGDKIAEKGSKYFPSFKNVPPWFALHNAYGYPPPRGAGQLVCFSFSADYYLSDHSPKDSERWKQGTHTVSATLTRIAEVLSSTYYQQPSG